MAGVIGRELDGRKIGKLTLPVGELPLQSSLLLPASLPDREVGILDGKGGQGGGRAMNSGTIEGGQFAHKDPFGPAVGDTMMPDQEEQMLFLLQSQQGKAQQWAAR